MALFSLPGERAFFVYNGNCYFYLMKNIAWWIPVMAILLILVSCKHELPKGCTPTNGGYYIATTQFRLLSIRCWEVSIDLETGGALQGRIENDSILIHFHYGVAAFDSLEQFPPNSNYVYHEGFAIGQDTAVVFQDSDQGQPRLNMYIKGAGNTSRNHLYTLDVKDHNRQFIIDFWKTHDFI